MMGVAFITNLIRREIDRALNARPVPQFGLVKSYDPDKYAVKVELQPEEAMTEWMPLPVEHVGDGYGLLMAPEIDDLVLVGFTDGDRNAPFIMKRVHNDEQPPPKVEAGEMVLMHKSKGYVMFDKDNNVTVKQRKGHSLVMTDDTMTVQHGEDGSGLVFEGGGVVSIKAQSILLDGEVVMGGREKKKAVVMDTDPDVAGNANMATQSRVWIGSGAGSVPTPPETPTPAEYVGS